LQEELNLSGLLTELKLRLGLEFEERDITSLKAKASKEAEEELYARAVAFYQAKEEAIGADLLRHLERMVFLQIIDSRWKDHLYAMDSLREGIGLRAYGQRDPLIEYKREAFNMFSGMIAAIESEAVETVFRLQARAPQKFKGAFSSVSKELLHPEAEKFQPPAGEGAMEAPEDNNPQNTPVHLSCPKVGRNDPCPCGSGKKYKKCCGK
jgi:preprotein translocase subunit SecA